MRRLAFVLLACFVFASGCASKPENRNAVVVWISIDGLRPDYVERANAPLLQRLVREGASTGKLIPPTPSLTFPSHVTEATGVPPGKHGIPGNSFYDAKTGQRYSFPNEASMLQSEPIWITAKRQGVRTLVYDWPLSYQQPGPVRTDYLQEKFDTEATDRQRLDLLLDTWRNDTARARAGEPLRLLMGYIKQPDVVGHKHGPDSREVLDAVAQTDRLLQHFVEDAEEIFRAKRKPRDELYIVLTSDHGMAAVHTMVNFEKLFDTPPPRSVQRITGGTFAMLYLEQIPATDRAAMQDKMLHDLRRWGFLSVYTRDTLPKRWGLAHPTRVGDIVITLRPGYHLSDRLPLVTFPREKVEAGRGAHGYVPSECPDMNALCMIWRYPDRMKRRDLGKANAEQMHPTIARLLKIKPASNVKAKALQ